MIKYSIGIGFEEAQNLILEVLKEDYISLTQDINSLLRINNLETYQLEDLEHFEKTRKAMKKIIKYYSVPGEAKDFFDYVKNYIR